MGERADSPLFELLTETFRFPAESDLFSELIFELLSKPYELSINLNALRWNAKGHLIFVYSFITFRFLVVHFLIILTNSYVNFTSIYWFVNGGSKSKKCHQKIDRGKTMTSNRKVLIMIRSRSVKTKEMYKF